MRQPDADAVFPASKRPGSNDTGFTASPTIVGTIRPCVETAEQIGSTLSTIVADATAVLAWCDPVCMPGAIRHRPTPRRAWNEWTPRDDPSRPIRLATCVRADLHQTPPVIAVARREFPSRRRRRPPACARHRHRLDIEYGGMGNAVDLSGVFAIPANSFKPGGSEISRHHPRRSNTGRACTRNSQIT